MSDHWITNKELERLLTGIELDQEQQEIVKRILMQREIRVPKNHKDAVGMAYYTALAAGEPWAIVNNTGTFIALVMTSINDSGNEYDKKVIDREQNSWVQSMAEFGTKDNDSMKFKAAAKCQLILGNLGRIAYKYGNVPTMSFKIPIPQGSGK